MSFVSEEITAVDCYTHTPDVKVVVFGNILNFNCKGGHYSLHVMNYKIEKKQNDEKNSKLTL
jgi:hypothetical protein